MKSYCYCQLRSLQTSRMNTKNTRNPSSRATSEGVRKSMVGNRSRDTYPELRVRSLVHREGLRYRVSARPLPEVRRTADIVFRPTKVAVFIDGCFWHGCPEHGSKPKTNRDYWLPKLRANKRRDTEIDLALRKAGWLVIRVWEHEDPKKVCRRIVRSVNGRLTSMSR